MKPLNVNDDNSSYIGDGAYAHIDKFNRLWVLTHDGLNVLDSICLENDVFESLMRFYISRVKPLYEQQCKNKEDKS